MAEAVGNLEERAQDFVVDDSALAADWSEALSEAEKQWERAMKVMMVVHTVATQEAATAMDSVDPMVVDWAMMATEAELVAEAMGTSGPD